LLSRVDGKEQGFVRVRSRTTGRQGKTVFIITISIASGAA
jgi:hypothetical protein